VKSCLDSWAVLAWLDSDEPAATVVAETLSREQPPMSWMNLVEVHYRTIRDHGRQEADEVLSELRPQITEHLPGVSAMRIVAGLKAANSTALADCFAIALAAAEGAQLLTGDPEIIDRADELPCGIVDLRASAA
jgi:predicted nucleic acid-binding protein